MAPTIAATCSAETEAAFRDGTWVKALSLCVGELGIANICGYTLSVNEAVIRRSFLKLGNSSYSSARLIGGSYAKDRSKAKGDKTQKSLRETAWLGRQRRPWG